jgi:hypothetical protein
MVAFTVPTVSELSEIAEAGPGRRIVLVSRGAAMAAPAEKTVSVPFTATGQTARGLIQAFYTRAPRKTKIGNDVINLRRRACTSKKVVALTIS